MASKIFLLAIVLVAVAISECRPKASKSFSNYGVDNNEAAGELNIGSYFASKSGNAKNNPIDSDSSSSESQEYLSQLSQGAGHNQYNLRSKSKGKNINQQDQWQNSQQQWQNSQNQGQEQSSEEYQQQGQYQGQGYGSHSSRQHQKQYQQSSEEYSAQQHSGYSQRHGYKHQPQYQNEQSYEEAKPVQVQISGNWKSGASWQNPNQQSSEESPQKYSFPRQVPQKPNSDESSSSSSEDLEERGYQREQAQARGQMYKKSNQQSSQQESNEQTNLRRLNTELQNSEESMEIQKASKSIVKHNSGELQGRIVTNQQRMRATTTSSEEGQSKEAKYGGRVNSIYLG